MHFSSSVSPATPAADPKGDALSRALRPRSVAIVGASADSTKRGFQIIQALLDAGYQGAIHPVNPRGGEILGLPVSRSVSDLPETPDLAVLCTPAASAPELLEECADRGIAAALVLALGFREAGPAGESLEARLLDVVARRGIRVVGPNTSGLLYLPLGLNLIGMREVPRGGLALVVQSGNILLEQVTRATTDGGEGFCACLGLGNMADVAWHDVVEELAGDDQVRAIVMYGEGFDRGRRFVDSAARASRVRPLALLRGGRSEAGRHAARSHTGALAAGPAVLRAALRAGGVVEVRRTDELRAVGTALAWQPAVLRGGVAILSDGGGHATLAADALGGLGAPLAVLSADTCRNLRELLGPAAAIGNPVDVAGATDRNPEVFASALRLLVADAGVGAVLLVGLFGGYAIRFAGELETGEAAAALAMAEAARGSGRGFVVHSLYHAARSRPLDLLRSAAVPVIGSLEAACAAVAALVERGRILQRPPQAEIPEPRLSGSDLIAGARRERRGALLEPEARELAGRHGVTLVPATFCATAEEAAEEAVRNGSPVAVRLVSSSILHKTDAGGVRLGVLGADPARAAFRTIHDSAERWAAAHGIEADVRGVLVSPVLSPPAVELIVGARRDPAFGPVMVIGIGGVSVEALDDLALRLLPTTRAEILSALDELRAAALLQGARGGDAPNLDRVADLALALGECLIHNPELSEIELNPVFAYADRAIAVDVRAVLTGWEE